MAANPSALAEKIGVGDGSRIDLLPEGSGGISADVIITAITGNAFAGLFSGAGTVDISNLDLAVRTELLAGYVNVDPASVDYTFTDNRKGSLYPGADTAETEDKIINYIYYGPVIRGEDKRLVICGRAFIGGTSGDGGGSPGTPFPANFQLFPAPSSDAVTIASSDFDAAFVTVADFVIPANMASHEIHMALPA